MAAHIREPIPLQITVVAEAAPDGWGFVGRVMVDGSESYRTLRTFSAQADALSAARDVFADGLGALLAAAEWRRTSEQRGHPLTRDDLRLGLTQCPDGQGPPT